MGPSRLGPLRLVWVALLATWLGAPRAIAATPETLVVESWVGGPSAQEQTWALALRRMLERTPSIVSSSAAVASALGSRRPLSALRPDAPGMSRGLMDRLTAARVTLNEAMGQYHQGRFLGAEKLLSTLLEDVLQSPTLFATEVGRPLVRQSLMYLMLARSRLRQTAAAAALAEELVRTFPDEGERVFLEFGPLADKLYRVAEAKLAAAGRGMLIIEVDEPEAVVSVNEGPGTRRSYERSVFPGLYRVLVRSTVGARRYEVQVKSGETTRLSIDWRLDSALSLAGETAALIFDSDLARFSEGLVAASLARTAGVGVRVALIGTRLYQGYRALSVSVYQASSGQHQATALALMDGERLDAKLAALEDFIRSGGTSRDRAIIVSTVPLQTVATLAQERSLARAASPARWPAYLAATASAASFAGGVLVLERANGCAAPPCHRSEQLIAYGLLGASVGLATYAAYRFGRVRSVPVVPAVVPAQNGATVSVTWPLSLP